jgi:histidine kinase/DNA gyrase B/HSP90-like ATPase
MTRSPSESRTPAGGPVSGPSPRLFSGHPGADPPGPPDTATPVVPGFTRGDPPASQPAGGAGAVRPLWAVVFVLGVCTLVALLIGVLLGGDSGKPAAVLVTMAGAGTDLLLLVTLAALRQRYSTAAQREQQAADSYWRAAQLNRHAEERQAQYTAMMSALAQAADYLVDVQLPAALDGSAVPPLPESIARGDSQAAALGRRVATAAAAGTAKLRERLDDQAETSRLAVVTLARRIQASAHRIQEEATRMADRHPGHPGVLESSMRVDHAAAQQARHAQSVAVLCGEWPGQQWPQPLALVDVVRAASSRIVAYQRVTVSGEPDIAARASVVEPLIHLVAELLANATQSSPPTTQVLVTVRTVQRGAVIEMDDGGVGMEEHRLAQAREIVSGQRLLRLSDLGEVPQSGMAVVGQYVHRHGFMVDLMPSPYGGVRAVVLVPAEMVESLEPAGSALAPSVPAPRRVPPETFRPAPAEASRPGPAEASRPVPAEPVSPATGGDMGSLPHRRSRRGESAAAYQAGQPPAEPPLPVQTPEQAGEWMAAYFVGSASETTDTGPVRPVGEVADANPARRAPSGDDPAFPGGRSSAQPGTKPAGGDGPASTFP